MTFSRSVLLIAAALCLGAAPAGAQEAPPLQPLQTTRETITIPFAPPIGTPLAYRIRLERKRASGDSVFEFDQRLTFARAEGGYTLTLETVSFNSEGRRIDLSDKRMLDAVPPALKVYFLPMVVELDETGELVRMRDWPALQESLRGLPEAAAKLSGEPVDEAAVTAAKSLLDPFINSSAEDAPGLMIRGWPTVLGYGGMEFVSGATLEGETEVDSPLSSELLPAVMQATVVRMRDRQIYLVQSAKVDDEALRRLTLSLIEQIKGRAETPGTARLAEEITDLSITDQVGINFDPVTGLPATARIARYTSAAMPKGPMVNGEVLTITRLQP
jgi:hypothetical protein